MNDTSIVLKILDNKLCFLFSIFSIIKIGMIDEPMKGMFGQMKKRAEDRVGWQNWTPWTCLTAEHS